MKRLMVLLAISAMLSVSTVHAKRAAPAKVPPIKVGQIEYRAPTSQMGCVEAWDTKSNEMIWRRQIYVVKYDTIVKLPSAEGLKPGMNAEVEVIMDRHEDVLTIPVTAVVETAQGNFCWVRTAEGVKRHSLQLGDTNDNFIMVKAGLQEGDEVVLDPMASITEAQRLALKPLDKAKSRQPINLEADRAE